MWGCVADMIMIVCSLYGLVSWKLKHGFGVFCGWREEEEELSNRPVQHLVTTIRFGWCFYASPLLFLPPSPLQNHFILSNLCTCFSTKTNTRYAIFLDSLLLKSNKRKKMHKITSLSTYSLSYTNFKFARSQ